MRLWTFTDLSTSESLTLPFNPSTMTSPYLNRQMSALPASADGRLRVEVAQKTAQEFSFTGFTRTQDHYDNLVAWSQRDSVIRIHDHLDRVFDVVFVSFTPERKHPTKVYGLQDYRYRYTMKCLLLEVVTGTV